MTIFHRIQLHKNIGQPHIKHLYQIMDNELKVPHVWMSLIYGDAGGYCGEYIACYSVGTGIY